MKTKAERNKIMKRVAAQVMIALAIVSFWRGVWGLMDLYWFAGNPQLSFIMSILAGVGLLLILHDIKDLR